MITSRANALLKKVRRAARRGGLTVDGFAVAESIHLLEEALRSGVSVGAVLVSADAEPARRAAAHAPPSIVIEVSPELFADIAATDNSQGLIALVEPRRWRFDDLAERPGPIVILDGVQDPGNVGAVLRSAEAFEAAGVVFGGGSASPYHPKTLRAAAGSLFRLPYIAGLGTSGLLDAVRACGRRLLAASAHDGEPIDRVDWSAAALLIGSEAHGVRGELLEHAEPVNIEVAGVESLNAAVAAGVILYEARRSLRSRAGG